ncbi:MAG: substrate-binding and GGDEF domain-containing protein [Mobilitalea sp.]
MFQNGKKTIGVFIQQVNEEYQNLLCKGISKRAKELDYNVAIFTNFGGYGQEAYDIGERNIANLPCYEELDGIIMAPDTLNLQNLEEQYKKNIIDKSNCPVVSVRREREEYYNVLVDENTILEEIITHFIEVHKFKRLNFLSGPKGYASTEKRLESYKRILKEHGIPIEEDRIYYGDLWKNEGYHAVDHWLNSSLIQPQAIICANDYMAITVCKALKMRGILIPEQIAVTGCDDVIEAEEFRPSITTARMPVVEMGIEAVDKINRHNLGEKQPKNSYVKTTTSIYRASCGCNNEWYREISERKLMKMDSSDTLENEMVRIAQMSTDLTGLATLDEAINKIEGYWYEYESISHFCLCLQRNWYNFDGMGEDDLINDTDGMIMQSGFKNMNNYNKLKFSKKELIPSELAEDKAMTYYFALLHYQEHYFGYIGFSFKKDQTNMLTLQAWLNNVSSVFENVRMHMEMQRLVFRLEDMSIRDELTGLYNRRVLDTLGMRCLEQSRKEHTRLMFFIADLDKLKFINDKYGHTKGDIALKAVADALKLAADDDEICIRLGGDEFMAIGMDYDEIKMTHFANRFIEELNMFNLNKEYDFDVYVSYGWNLITPDVKTTIEDCLSAADSLMYQQKYNKVSNNIKANIMS